MTDAGINVDVLKNITAQNITIGGGITVTIGPKPEALPDHYRQETSRLGRASGLESDADAIRRLEAWMAGNMATQEGSWCAEPLMDDHAARSQQVAFCVAFGLPRTLNQMGMDFVLVPPGRTERGSNPRAFYLGVHPVSRRQFNREPCDAAPCGGLSVWEIERWLDRQPSITDGRRLAYPTVNQWWFAAGVDWRHCCCPKSPFDAEDMYEKIWQMCRREPGGYCLCGGICPTDPHAVLDCHSPSAVGDHWGFRPALAITSDNLRPQRIP